jgi:hypothetical protein
MRCLGQRQKVKTLLRKYPEDYLLDFNRGVWRFKKCNCNVWRDKLIWAQITSRLFRNDKFRTRERYLFLVNVSKERGGTYLLKSGRDQNCDVAQDEHLLYVTYLYTKTLKLQPYTWLVSCDFSKHTHFLISVAQNWTAVTLYYHIIRSPKCYYINHATFLVHVELLQ